MPEVVTIGQVLINFDNFTLLKVVEFIVQTTPISTHILFSCAVRMLLFWLLIQPDGKVLKCSH